jgi:hypothetical protein
VLLLYRTVLVVELVATPKASLELTGVGRPIADYTGCYILSPQAFFYIWLPPLIFEAILCLLMLYKAWNLYKEEWTNPLLNLLIRDRYEVSWCASKMHA